VKACAAGPAIMAATAIAAEAIAFRIRKSFLLRFAGASMRRANLRIFVSELCRDVSASAAFCDVL
jgi:hypothetical protein